MIIPIIIGGSLATAGIITLIIGCKKIKVNKKIQKENQELEEKNAKLIRDNLELDYTHKTRFRMLEELNSKLKFLKEQLEQQEEQAQKSFENFCEILDLTYSAKEVEYDAKLKNLELKLDNEFEQDKLLIYNAFTKYVEELNRYYECVEEDFDKSLENIKKVLEEHQEELEQIKRTYAAAREAQIRDEEIANQADFYSLHLTESEKATIYLIEDLKPRLPEPRVLCMLIWTTFFQKQTTALCNNVLGINTVCGIYKITNKSNGLCYIGQSTDCAKRWKEHVKCGLGIDTPAQNKLYKAMLKDGVTNFTFELLEQCDRQLLNEKERFYINLYQAYEFGYNSTTGNK